MGAMDKDDFKIYLQNIEEFVVDEGKIVTYKWLSKNLGLHVNTAKQLLYSFALEQKDKVHSTYLIGGLLNDDNGGSVRIVREEDLDKVKSEYKLITSEHVYSVQKAKKLKDLNALYTVDVKNKEGKEEINLLSSIKCSFHVLRPHEEVAGLKQKARTATADGNDKQWPAAKKPAETSSSKAESGTTKKLLDSGNIEDSKAENGTCKQEPKKIGIAAHNNKPKKQENSETKRKPTVASKPKLGGGISMFFSRQAEKPKKQSNSKSDSGVSSSQLNSHDSTSNVEVDTERTNSDTKEAKKEIKEQKGYSDTTEIKSKDIPKKKDNKSQGVKETKATSKGNKGGETEKGKGGEIKVSSKGNKRGKDENKKSNIDEEMQPAKKRKRIIVMSDSESDDDIFGKDEDDEEEEVIPYSPPPQQQNPESDEDVIPPTPEATLKKGRKRERKLVDKTFLDEDGYLVTIKEYVFESCSESEMEEVKEKENNSKENGEKIKSPDSSPKEDSKNPPSKKRKKKEEASPQKTKQALIMNFFKKK